jgi:hypothetical protein
MGLFTDPLKGYLFAMAIGMIILTLIICTAKKKDTNHDKHEEERKK